MRTNRWVSRAAGAGALTLILAMPAVAQTNGNWQQRNGTNSGRDRTQTTAPIQTRNNNSGRNNGNSNRTQATQPTQATSQIQTRNNGSNGGGNYGRAQQTSQIQTRSQNNNGGYSNSSNRIDNRSAQVATSSYRDNQRVALSGRINSFSRENNGYRVRLDRGQSFFVPESYYRGHSSNFRLGVSINLGGIFRGGDIYVDAGGYPVNAGYGAYDNGTIRGVVDRVDYRTGIVWLRDDASGRLIEADMRAAGQYSRTNAGDLRPGDFVELSGQWVRGNIFAVTQVDNVQGGRY
jgi:hypothetical protein